MSDGPLPNARPMHSSGILAERRAIAAYAEAFCRDVESLAAKQRIPAAEASMLRRRLEAFGEGVRAGFHLKGEGR